MKKILIFLLLMSNIGVAQYLVNPYILQSSSTWSALPSAMYSLRKVNGAVGSLTIKVRRSSDNTTADIGFLDTELDTVSLKNFCGSGNCFVRDWFDLSGNGFTLSQTTNANQPSIVTNGVVNRSAGQRRPMIVFNGSTAFLTVAPLFSVSNNSGVTQSIVFQRSAASEGQLMSQGQSASYFNWGLFLTSNGDVYFRNTNNDYKIGTSNASLLTVTVYNAISSGASTTAKKDAVSQGSTANGTTSGTGGTFTVGRRNGDNSQYFNGGISEILIFNSAIGTQDNSNLESNQITYYK